MVKKIKKLITEKVNEVLKPCWVITRTRNRYPHEFSGGQRQRIGMQEL